MNGRLADPGIQDGECPLPGCQSAATELTSLNLWPTSVTVNVQSQCGSWHLNLNRTGRRQLKIQLSTTTQISSINLHGGFQVMWHFIPLIWGFWVALFISNILTGILYSALSWHMRSTLSEIDWRTYFFGKITKGINHKTAALQQGMISRAMKWFTEVVGKYWFEQSCFALLSLPVWKFSLNLTEFEIFPGKVLVLRIKI